MVARPTEIAVILSLKQDRTLAKQVRLILESRSEYLCMPVEISNTISPLSLESFRDQPVFAIFLICSRLLIDNFSYVLNHLSNYNVNTVLLVSNDRENILFSTPTSLALIEVPETEASKQEIDAFLKEVERSVHDALQSKVSPTIKKEELHDSLHLPEHEIPNLIECRLKDEVDELKDISEEELQIIHSTQRKNSLHLPEQDLLEKEFSKEQRLKDEADELKDISEERCEEEAVWDVCFKQGKKYIRKLLKKGLYPPADILDDLCDCYGRKSRIIGALCKSAKRKIKTNIEKTFDIKVFDIYPSFNDGAENKIVFVVTLNKRVNIAEIGELISYAVEIKILNAYNQEATLLAQHILKEQIFMSEEELHNVQSCQEKVEEKLFAKHKYLSMIASSPVKSFQYSKSGQHVCIERKVCLQLYIHAKGFIPIWEDAFEKKYEGIATDIIECVFVSYGQTAREPLDNIKMGCRIQRENMSPERTHPVVKGGTIGGFIEHPELGLCGITCAHAMLHTLEFEKCVENNNKLSLKDWPLNFKRKIAVYQPDLRSTDIGVLSEAHYDTGNPSRPGIDIAVIKIRNRHPVNGRFPYMEQQQGRRIEVDKVYESGRIVDYTTLATDRNVAVWKFGSTTDSTNAFLSSGTLAAREIKFEWQHDNTFNIQLHKQIKVTNIDGESFADRGDSGALVFCEQSDGQLACIGMVEGGLENNSPYTVVAPIIPVLERLNVQNIYTFSDTKLYIMEARLTEMIKESHLELLHEIRSLRQEEEMNET